MIQQSNKSFFLFVMLLLFALPVYAQKDITDIRKQYQAAKQNIDQQAEDANMRHCITVEFSQNAPAIGPQKFTYRIYLIPHYDEQSAGVSHTTLFATVSYDIAVRKVVEEYLYDKDENLIFFYRKIYDNDGSDFVEYEYSEEVRQYFKDGRLIKAQRKEKYNKSTDDSTDYKVVYDGEIPMNYLDDKRLPELHGDGIIEIVKKVSGTSNHFIMD